MLYFARLVAELLAPLTFSVCLLLLALFFLLLRRGKLCGLLLVLALSLQLLTGYGFFARDHLAKMESTYPALVGEHLAAVQQKDISHIVVLGSGHTSDPRLPANSQIGGASLFRLVEGIRLAALFPTAKLLLTGGPVLDPVANAEVVAEVAALLAVPPERLLLENRPMDTLQEAQLTRTVLQGKEFILVTSAAHMPRAMKIFRAEGLQPLAAPTDFIIKSEPVKTPRSMFPSTNNMDISKQLLYEWLAEIWRKTK